MPAVGGLHHGRQWLSRPLCQPQLSATASSRPWPGWGRKRLSDDLSVMPERAHEVPYWAATHPSSPLRASAACPSQPVMLCRITDAPARRTVDTGRAS